MNRKTLDAEILSVGTELLRGHVTNTDARDLSRLLAQTGVKVRWHTVVGDEPCRLRESVEIAKGRADIIITTGGLGPTCDDLTKEVLAEAFSLPLVRDEAEAAGLYEYIRYGSAYTPNNQSQALLPAGCTVFHNDWGTAPGCAFEAQGKLVLMLPGPPKECLPMFERYGLPLLKKLAPACIVSHSMNIFGLGESAVDQMFREEMNTMQNPGMAPYAKECDCLLQLTAEAESEEAAEALLRPVLARVRERLGDYVYGEDVESLEEALLALLKESPATFATAESCTGGDLARRFTELPGASAFFLGGVVSYTNEVKAGVLGVDRALIEKYGAVSEPVARAMAERARAITGADYAISVTGLAGPDGDGVNEVGTVFVGLAAAEKSWVRELHLGAFRTRSFIRRMAGNVAFDMLRRRISGLPEMEEKINNKGERTWQRTN